MTKQSGPEPSDRMVTVDGVAPDSRSAPNLPYLAHQRSRGIKSFASVETASTGCGRGILRRSQLLMTRPSDYGLN